MQFSVKFSLQIADFALTDYNGSDTIDNAVHGGLAQLARAFGSYPKCRRFKSYSRYQFYKSPFKQGLL